MSEPRSQSVLWLDRDRVPAGDWIFLSTIRNSLRSMQSDVLVPSVDLTEGLGGVTISGRMEAYRQVVVRRVLDLAQATVVTWNAGLAIGAVVSARALLETLAVFHDLMAETVPLAERKDWDALSDLVDAYAFSTSDWQGQTTGNPKGPPKIGAQVRRFIRVIEPDAERFWHQISDIAQPYQHRPGWDIQSEFKLLEQRPACAVQIALVLAAWAQLEFFLNLSAGQATATVLSVDQNGPGSSSGQSDMASLAAVGGLESLNARLEVVSRMVKVGVSAELYAAFKTKLVPKIRKAAGWRNAVAHCHWHFTDRYPDDIIAPVDVGKMQYERYTAQDFKDIVARISVESNKVQHFGALCYQHHVDVARGGTTRYSWRIPGDW